MINYYYDESEGIYQLYLDDILIVELPYCDIMNSEEAENLAYELYLDYIEAQND
jgi:hypothetical protein